MFKYGVSLFIWSENFSREDINLIEKAKSLILTEEYKIPIGYSTLTRLLREYGTGQHPEQRSQKYPDIPGDEMQQDTSVYTVKLGQKYQRLVCSGLYLRYSKMRYVKFYIRFLTHLGRNTTSFLHPMLSLN